MDASEEDVIALQAETATGIFNVVNGYNADPTGVTDSATAIQSAINAAYAAGGGVVYFPDGSYKTDTTITMKPSVFLRGSSPGNVLYDKGTPTGAVIQYLGSEWAIKFTEVPNASQSGLININITGNTSALGGVKINDTTVDTDPSLDLYFSGVCVAYFPNGYGFHLTTTYRDAFYSVIIRQCGCGFSTLESNDLTMVDTTFEWCALGASFRLSASINMYGTLAEGLGVRPDVNLPSDIYVWSDYSGRTLDYYHGGIRNFGSSLTMVGTYMESVNGDAANGDGFMLELDSATVINGIYYEFSANEGYLINKTNGAKSLVFFGAQIVHSPTIATAIVTLDDTPFNCFINGNGWDGTKTVPFFENVGDVGADGGMIQAPDDAAQTISNYGTNIFSKTSTSNASIKWLGSYTRSALDNYWEMYRQDGDGEDKFLNIRRKNGGVLESYLTFRPSDMYFGKPIVQDVGTYLTLGHTEPTTPTAGDMYWSTAAGTIKVFNGTIWKNVTLT
jgi:hypothetical protein